MPLTPLPEDNTKRYWMFYVNDGQEHNIQSRAADSMDDATAVSHFQAVAAALQSITSSDCTFAGVAVAASGSNVRNIVGGFTPVTGTATPAPDAQKPLSICIAGRSATGRKTKAFFFGSAGLAVPSTYKEDPLVTSELQGWQGLMNSQSGFWLAIDGSKPVWYFRATFNYNDHWVKEART